MTLPVFNLFEPNANPTEIYFRDSDTRTPETVDQLQLPNTFKVTPVEEFEGDGVYYSFEETHPSMSGECVIDNRAKFEPNSLHPWRQNIDPWGVESPWWNPDGGYSGRWDLWGCVKTSRR